MIEDNNSRLINPLCKVEDLSFENNLRPKTLLEYIGQKNIKDNLEIFIKAAKLRNEALEHVLLYGLPGLGKTSLAHIIAKETGANIKVTSGPAVEKAGDIAAILTNIEENDVLFIDEIHRLNHIVEEILYPAMEDYALDIIIGKGPSARTVRIDLPKFTLIGATTKINLLSSPLRDRFGNIYKLEFYEIDEIKQILMRSANILQINIHEDAAEEIAGRSRKTPRIANRLLKRVRDYSQVKATGVIDIETAKTALVLLGIDNLGLDMLDKKILHTIIEKFQGGPVGLGTLAASCAEDGSTIEELVEPYLMQLGFLNKTPKGRIATELAYQHITIN